MRSSTYQTWLFMKQRCYNPRRSQYAHYGGRGICVCDAWRHDFQQFAQDMGERPAGMTLERLNNDGHYEPSNCVWAPKTVQMRNTRATIKHELHGVLKPMRTWCEEYGVDPRLVDNRLRLGWAFERALLQPHRYSKKEK